MTPHTSPGAIVGWVFLGLFLLLKLAGIAALATWLRWRKSSDYDKKECAPCLRNFGFATIAVALVLTGITYGFMYPLLDSEYHTYRPVGGMISDIQSRAMADGKGSTDYYAVQFGNDQTYRCDDTRCALLKPGDVLFLSCIREWQYNGTDGYDCDFLSSRKNRNSK